MRARRLPGDRAGIALDARVIAVCRTSFGRILSGSLARSAAFWKEWSREFSRSVAVWWRRIVRW
jgi:hypothetical protein